MCQRSLTIINPHYKKLAEQGHCSVRRFSLQPDYKITVPCGHCDECLKKRQQQWYSRADHLFKRMKLKPEQCLFCTFTLKPSEYEEAKEKPYLPIRRFLDRVRKHPRFIIGKNRRGKPIYRKVKFPYFFCVEFADGSRAAERGLPSEHRMHYHAILFNPPLYWWQIRDLWQGEFLGHGPDWYTGMGKAVVEPLKSMAGVRYVMKYVTKDRKECQYVSDIDARKNGKIIVSHGFGRLSKEDIKIMRHHMLRNDESWFCHYINNYRYSIPRYWKQACFTKEEIKTRNEVLIPPLIWRMVCNRWPRLSLRKKCLIYSNFVVHGSYVLEPPKK